MASKGTALVTGAAGGIGKAITLRLAYDGFKVAVNDISDKSQDLAQLVEEIAEKGGAGSAHVADVSSEDEVYKMVAEVVDKHGSLDVMVANAGISSLTSIFEMTTHQWDRMMNINARGVFLCYKYAGIQMIKQGKGGRIIGASSIAGKKGSPFNFAYTASKFAVRGLTQAAALEFGPHNITVNAYSPGAVDTEMLTFVMPADEATVAYESCGVRCSISVLKPDWSYSSWSRSPTDIANLVSFLASKDSHFITGAPSVPLAGFNLHHLFLQARPMPNSRRHDSSEASGPTSIRDLSRYQRLVRSRWHPDRCPEPSPLMASKGTALVTGAARGIGRVIALRLADDGFAVVVNDISDKSEDLAGLVDEIKAKGRASSSHIADVSLDDEVRGMVDEVVNKYGRLDVMVANAGVASYNPMPQMTADQWDRIMNVNARGVFLCYKYAGIQMVKQGDGGRIIGSSSVLGKRGSPFNPAYTASKFAVRGLTQAAALEFGAHAITVNAVAPGAIDTEILPNVMPADTPREVLIGALQQQSPLNTVGSPTDVANLVSFIASKESQFITGQTISVNGGTYFD
ncbi:NAD(P)-binding protein [Mycena venus]|uniref:NAD(P)-binding protein n=1 Tax=Mycena venus TaxID=2733690 RepID=A0A8H6Z4P3_9AGAR|nr:NAD(P)-binding protein [Mycena venus]